MIISLINVVVAHQPQEPQFSFFDAQPPPWLVYLTIAITFLTLLWRIFTFIISRRDRRNDKNISIVDEFWFRKIMIPMSLEPMIVFIESQKDALVHMHDNDHTDVGEKYRKILQEFKNKKRSIGIRFRILAAINIDLYNEIVSHLDVIEDAVAVYCAHVSLGVAIDIGEKQVNSAHNVEEVMYEELCLIISILIKKHKSIYDKQFPNY